MVSIFITGMAEDDHTYVYVYMKDVHVCVCVHTRMPAQKRQRDDFA